MNKSYTNIYPVVNLYKKDSTESEIITQMIYGESFKIIKKSTKWLKIKIIDDGYLGHIVKKNLFLT